MADKLTQLMDTIDNARGRMAAMANQPKTATRTVRVEDDLWRAALAIAADRDETLSSVMRAALEEYVKAHTTCDQS